MIIIVMKMFCTGRTDWEIRFKYKLEVTLIISFYNKKVIGLSLDVGKLMLAKTTRKLFSIFVSRWKER